MKMVNRWLVVLLLLAVQSAGAEVYRWVDDRGQVHFGDRPAGKAAETLEIKEQHPVPVQGQTGLLSEQQRREKQRRLLEIYREDRAEKRLAREQRQVEQKQRQANCVKAQDKLQSYQGVRLYVPAPDGGRRFLSEDEREAEVGRMERLVDYWCN